MKPVPVLLGIAVLLGAMAVSVLIRETAGGDENGPSRMARATPVTAATVSLHRFADTVEAIGTIEARESVAITANVSDTITDIRFGSGDVVSQGSVLVTLADAEEQAALTEARAALSEARRESERLEQLSGGGAVSRSERERAITTVERTEAQLSAVRARLADRTLRAPFDGVVGLRSISTGAYVSPGDVLLTLDDVSTVNLDFTVPERFLSVLAPGQPVSARTSAWPDATFLGEIEALDTRVDPVTRSLTVRASLPNAEGHLRPGMLMQVSVQRNERQSLAIPEVAVMRNSTAIWVYGVEEGDKGPVAARRNVSLGARSGHLIEVLEGLSGGDTIVVEGTHRTRNGGALALGDKPSEKPG